jgi:ASC-1-like (ASCH) protein
MDEHIWRKKCWPQYFEKVLSGEKNVEVRLADFPLEEGDTIIFEEWDPVTEQYSGRKVKRSVRHVFKAHLMDFGHSPYEMKQKGHYVIELDPLGGIPCPVWQCGGMMRPVNDPRFKNDEKEGRDWKEPLLVCDNCGARYMFLRFDPRKEGEEFG